MPKKKKAETWSKSKAKALLREGLLSGAITATMTPDDAFQLNPEEHRKWPYKNWVASFHRLKAAIARDKKRMLEDKAGYEHDLYIVQSQRPADQAIPWHRTDAPKLLKQDIADGLHKSKTPKELYNHPDRPQYREAATLEEFRKHIHQQKDQEPKRAHRFEKKKKAWLYPELHKEHPRLQHMRDQADDSD